MEFRSVRVLITTILSLAVAVLAYPVDLDKPSSDEIEQRISLIKNRFFHVEQTTTAFVDLLNAYDAYFSLFNTVTQLVNNNTPEYELAPLDLTELHAVRAKVQRFPDRVRSMFTHFENAFPASPYKLKERDVSVDGSQNDVNFTFVPPTKTDVTPELINQSMTVQPQNTATIGSVLPYPEDGVISYLVQLNGLVASTLTLNASMSMPCDTIGADPEPNLVLLPKNVKNGTSQSTVPNCLIIAVNKYSRDVINYWVQKEDGSIFSLVGDNKVHNLDQLDTSMPASLVLRAANPINTKRGTEIGTQLDEGYDTVVKRHEVRAIDCQSQCPFPNMMKIPGNRHICGCVFNSSSNNVEARGIVAPDVHTATMTPEVCRAMTCINNGGEAAVYNPFSKTCWCLEPVYVDVSPSNPE